ncbi:hypothetical protein JCM8097_009548 [Rhodosporidiobolus ruineniae]
MLGYTKMAAVGAVLLTLAAPASAQTASTGRRDVDEPLASPPPSPSLDSSSFDAAPFADDQLPFVASAPHANPSTSVPIAEPTAEIRLLHRRQLTLHDPADVLLGKPLSRHKRELGRAWSSRGDGRVRRAAGGEGERGWEKRALQERGGGGGKKPKRLPSEVLAEEVRMWRAAKGLGRSW